MNTEEKIRKIISSAVLKAGYPQLEEDVVLEMPSDSSKGDYSTNIAMRMASRLGANPFEIAENISKNIENCKLTIILNIQHFIVIHCCSE